MTRSAYILRIAARLAAALPLWAGITDEELAEAAAMVERCGLRLPVEELTQRPQAARRRPAA